MDNYIVFGGVGLTAYNLWLATRIALRQQEHSDNRKEAAINFARSFTLGFKKELVVAGYMLAAWVFLGAPSLPNDPECKGEWEYYYSSRCAGDETFTSFREIGHFTKEEVEEMGSECFNGSFPSPNTVCTNDPGYRLRFKQGEENNRNARNWGIVYILSVSCIVWRRKEVA